MKFTISNVGKVARGNIELGGITVLVGDNNMGKTTMGRALYCFFNSLYGIGDEVVSQRKRHVFRVLRRFFERSRKIEPSPRSLARVVEKIVADSSVDEKVKGFVRGFCGDQISPDELQELEKEIVGICRLKDMEMYEQIIRNYFDSVFEGQCISERPDVEEAVISLESAACPQTIHLSRNGVKLVSDLNVQQRAFFVEDSKVLDYWGRYRFLGGMNGLSESIRRNVTEMLRRRVEDSPADSVVEDVTVGKLYDGLLDELNHIINGEFVFDENEMLRFDDQNIPGKRVELCNVSEGVRSFGVLGVLLSMRLLRKNDVLILDEPEVHLHPEWQLRYAEFVVKLQEVFNLKVLLTTHSSSFLFALQLYARKHKRQDVVNAYRIKPDGSNTRFSVIEKSPDGISDIDEALLAFADAAGALQRLVASVESEEERKDVGEQGVTHG